MIIFEFSEYIFHDLKGPKVKYNPHYIRVRGTFYGHHTAQHPAAVITNNNKKFRSFKSKENIHKKEVGS